MPRARIILLQEIRFAGSWDAMPVKSAWHRHTEENYTVRAAGRLASMTLARGGEVRMAEYIELEKAIEAFTFADADVCQEYGDYECEFGFSREAIKDVLKSVEAEDVAPVVHGNWIDEDFPEKKATVHGFAVCSVCGELSHKAEHGYNILSNYCPNCGAKMNL